MAKRLSEKMKADNGYFFEIAKSSDLVQMITGCQRFVENMTAAMDILEVHDWDMELAFCKQCVHTASLAYYKNNNEHWAIECCNEVTERLTRLGYDEFLSTPSSKSFTGKE